MSLFSSLLHPGLKYLFALASLQSCEGPEVLEGPEHRRWPSWEVRGLGTPALCPPHLCPILLRVAPAPSDLMGFLLQGGAGRSKEGPHRALAGDSTGLAAARKVSCSPRDRASAGGEPLPPTPALLDRWQSQGHSQRELPDGGDHSCPSLHAVWML